MSLKKSTARVFFLTGVGSTPTFAAVSSVKTDGGPSVLECNSLLKLRKVMSSDLYDVFVLCIKTESDDESPEGLVTSSFSRRTLMQVSGAASLLLGPRRSLAARDGRSSRTERRHARLLSATPVLRDLDPCPPGGEI